MSDDPKKHPANAPPNPPLPRGGVEGEPAASGEGFAGESPASRGEPPASAGGVVAVERLLESLASATPPAEATARALARVRSLLVEEPAEPIQILLEKVASATPPAEATARALARVRRVLVAQPVQRRPVGLRVQPRMAVAALIMLGMGGLSLALLAGAGAAQRVSADKNEPAPGIAGLPLMQWRERIALDRAHMNEIQRAEPELLQLTQAPAAKTQKPAETEKVQTPSGEDAVMKDSDLLDLRNLLQSIDAQIARLRLISSTPEKLPQYAELQNARATLNRNIVQRTDSLRTGVPPAPGAALASTALIIDNASVAAMRRTLKSLQETKFLILLRLDQLGQERRLEESLLEDRIQQAKARVASLQDLDQKLFDDKQALSLESGKTSTVNVVQYPTGADPAPPTNTGIAQPGVLFFLLGAFCVALVELAWWYGQAPSSQDSESAPRFPGRIQRSLSGIHYRRLVGGSLIAGVLASMLTFVLTPRPRPWYVASGLLNISAAPPRLALNVSSPEQNVNFPTYRRTQIDFLRSMTIALEAVKRLPADFMAKHANLNTSANARDALARKIQSNLQVDAKGPNEWPSQVVPVSLTWEIPDEDVVILKSVMEAFVDMVDGDAQQQRRERLQYVEASYKDNQIAMRELRTNLRADQARLAGLQSQQELDSRRELEFLQDELARKQSLLREAEERRFVDTGGFKVTPQLVDEHVQKDAQIRSWRNEMGRVDEYTKKLRLIATNVDSLPEYAEFQWIKTEYNERIKNRSEELRPALKKQLEEAYKIKPGSSENPWDTDQIRAMKITIATLEKNKKILSDKVANLSGTRRNEEMALTDKIEQGRSNLRRVEDMDRKLFDEKAALTLEVGARTGRISIVQVPTEPELVSRPEASRVSWTAFRAGLAAMLLTALGLAGWDLRTQRGKETQRAPAGASTASQPMAGPGARWYVVVGLGLALAGVYFGSSLLNPQPRMFVASGLLSIATAPPRPLHFVPREPAIDFQTYHRTQVDLLKSLPIALEAVKRLPADVKTRYSAQNSEGLARRIQNGLIVDSGKTDLWSSQMVPVSFTWDNADAAVVILKTVMEAFVETVDGEAQQKRRELLQFVETRYKENQTALRTERTNLRESQSRLAGLQTQQEQDLKRELDYLQAEIARRTTLLNEAEERAETQRLLQGVFQKQAAERIPNPPAPIKEKPAAVPEKKEKPK